jgi:hypothetical protein
MIQVRMVLDLGKVLVEMGIWEEGILMDHQDLSTMGIEDLARLGQDIEVLDRLDLEVSEMAHRQHLEGAVWDLVEEAMALRQWQWMVQAEDSHNHLKISMRMMASEVQELGLVGRNLNVKAQMIPTALAHIHSKDSTQMTPQDR